MQIAVTIPDDQIVELDRLVPDTFSSRAQAVRVAVDRLLRERTAAAVDAAYERGYEQCPPTSDERAWAEHTRPSRAWDDLEW